MMDSATATAPAGGDPTKANLSHHVLLVDDSEDYRFIATTELGRLRTAPGFDVIEAGDGPAALAALDALLHRGDDQVLVLCDSRMPGMDGHELVQAIRARHPHGPVRLVLCSSGDDPDADAGPTHRGTPADEIFVKPLDAREFRTALARVIDHWLHNASDSRRQ